MVMKMRGERVKALLILTLLLAGMLTITLHVQPVKAVKANVTDNNGSKAKSNTAYVTVNPTPSVTVSPVSIVGPPPGIGGNFTVDINVEDVTDLWTLVIGVAWNPAVLTCVNFMLNYSFFGQELGIINVSGNSFFGPKSSIIGIVGTINNTLGMVWPPYGVSLTDDAQGVNGGGTLAQVEFRVKNYGVSPITLNYTHRGEPSLMLLNSNGDNIPFNVVEGSFALFEAAVSISPTSATLDVGNSTTFTSTVSGGTSSYTYQWYQNGTAVSGANSSSWTFTPAAAGYYLIYLNVTDNAGVTAESNIASVTVEPAPADPTVIPKVPFGTAIAFLSMMVALLGFAWFRRLQLKLQPQ
jgi:hypothetical protein